MGRSAGYYWCQFKNYSGWVIACYSEYDGGGWYYAGDYYQDADFKKIDENQIVRNENKKSPSS